MHSHIIFNQFHIVKNITSHFFDINSLLKLRLINKTFNYTFKSFFNYDIDYKKRIYGKATMINIRYCWNCSNFANKNYLHYFNDYPPRRVLITCNSFKCNIIKIKSYLEECLSEKIIPIKKVVPIEKCLIPRSDGTLSLGQVIPYFFVLLDEICLKIKFGEKNEYYKCVSLKTLAEINNDNKIKDLINHLILRPFDFLFEYYNKSSQNLINDSINLLK